MKYEKITQEKFIELSKNGVIKNKDLSDIDLESNQYTRPILIEDCKLWKLIINNIQGISYPHGLNIINTDLDNIKFKNCHMSGVILSEDQKKKYTENCKFSLNESLNNVKSGFISQILNFAAKILGDYTQPINSIKDFTKENLSQSLSVISVTETNINQEQVLSENKWVSSISQKFKTKSPLLRNNKR